MPVRSSRSSETSWFRTRHRATALFRTWEGCGGRPGPVFVFEDLVQISVQKALLGAGSFSMTLIPKTRQDYQLVLHPNDWVWIFFDDGDATHSQCPLIGVIDRVSRTVEVDSNGEKRTFIRVSGSGWAKALERSAVVVDRLLYNMDGVPNLIDLMGRLMASTANKVHIAAAAVLQAFLSRRGEPPRMGFPHAALDEFRSIRPSLAPQMTGDQLRELSAVQDLGRLREGLTGLPFRGQFEVPDSGLPLWDFLQLQFEPIHEYYLAAPQQWMGDYGSSVLSLLQNSIVNPAMNEFFVDTRRQGEGRSLVRTPGANVADFLRSVGEGAVRSGFGELVQGWVPHIVLRRRPLFLDEFLALSGPAEVRGDDEVISEDLGYSDSDLANLMAPDFSNVSPAFSAERRMGVPEKYWDPESVRRAGLRWAQQRITAMPTTEDAPDQISPTPEAVAALIAGISSNEAVQKRLFHAHRFNDQLRSGTVVFKRLLQHARLGGVLKWIRNVPRGTPSPGGLGGGWGRGGTYEGAMDVYYIEGMSYDWSYPGVFRHSLVLTRGHAHNEKLPRTQTEAEASASRGR